MVGEAPATVNSHQKEHSKAGLQCISTGIALLCQLAFREPFRAVQGLLLLGGQAACSASESDPRFG